MTVKIADKPLHGSYGLQETTRRVLGLIDGGLQWLEYALGERDTHYRFHDESALVAGVQTGLHAHRYVLIDTLGLMVAPVKLMTMSPAELQLIQRAAAGELPPDYPRVTELLARHRLSTQRDFDVVDDLLRNLGIAPAPMFQAMDIDDRLALLDLVRNPAGRDPVEPSFMEEAAAFALTQAYAPAEFADYYHAYLDLTARAGRFEDGPADRRERVQTAVYTIAPLTFPALDCPEVAGLVSPLEVEAAIIDWLARGRQLGFLRVSQGVQQIIANTDFVDQDGGAAEAIVRGYLDRATTLIQMQGVGRGMMGQDGATCLFPIVGGQEEAVIRLGPTGVITLAQFIRHRSAGPNGAARASPRSAPPRASTVPAASPSRKIVRRVRKGKK